MNPPFLTLDDGPCWVMRVEGSVRGGFPSPAEDAGVEPINLQRLLIPRPQATFMMRVAGRSMEEGGLWDGDHILVDRSIRPQSGHIVVGVVDSDFTVKYLRRSLSGVYYLEAADLTMPRFYAPEFGSLEVWGVATTAIRPMPLFTIKG